MNIAEQIKARRQKAGLTQDQLAKMLQVTPSYVADIEAGRRSPALDTITPFVTALGGKLVIEWEEPFNFL